MKEEGDLNIMQLESFYHTNKRKRKASEAFDDDFDYLYEIITTGEIFDHGCATYDELMLNDIINSRLF